MKLIYKSFTAKADENGQISGYFSTYDRVPDSYGDIVAKGAFTNTIAKRKESGHPFPLCWNHDLDQIIGSVKSIEDTEKGPFMTADFFNTPLAQEKREIVKSGVVYQFSFAYQVLDSMEVELEDGRKANELRELELFEISVVPVPANQNAVMTDVKSDESEDGEVEEKKKPRRGCKADEMMLAEIIGELDDSIASLTEKRNKLQAILDSMSEEGEPEANPDGEEQMGGNSEEKNRLLDFIKSI